MKLYPQQLLQHLKKELASFYLVSGDILTLKKESADSIRETAQKKGFVDHKVYQVDGKFDWIALENHLNNFSLFGEKQIVELQASTTKFGIMGGKVLKAIIDTPHDDKIILLVTSKLDVSTQKTTWASAFLEKGVHIPIFPIEPDRYLQWLQSRLQAKQLTADLASLQLLAQYTEGNLDAAVQAIEKLALTFDGAITLDDMRSIITESSQFNLFEWVDECLAGKLDRIVCIFNHLKSEDAEPTLMLWALTQTLRKLIHVMQALEQKQSLATAFQKQGIWDKKKPLFQHAINRHPLNSVKSLLQLAHQIDKKIKGVIAGSPWNDLLQLGLRLGGLKI